MTAPGWRSPALAPSWLSSGRSPGSCPLHVHPRGSSLRGSRSGSGSCPGSGRRTEGIPSPTSSFHVCRGNLKAQTPIPEDGAPGHQGPCLVWARDALPGRDGRGPCRLLCCQLCSALSAHLSRAPWPPLGGRRPVHLPFPLGTLLSLPLGPPPQNIAFPKGLERCAHLGVTTLSHMEVDAGVRAGTQVCGP